MGAQKNVEKNPASSIFRRANNFVQVDVTSSAMTLTVRAVDDNGVATLADQDVITP